MNVGSNSQVHTFKTYIALTAIPSIFYFPQRMKMMSFETTKLRKKEIIEEDILVNIILFGLHEPIGFLNIFLSESFKFGFDSDFFSCLSSLEKFENCIVIIFSWKSSKTCRNF